MPSAERVQWARMRVVAVSLVSFVILAILLYLLTGGMLFKEKANLYLYIPDASGLTQGSPVEVDGITVGKVTGIALSGSRDPQRTVRVTVAVDRDTLASIPPDSWAQLSVESPVGDKYVDITSVGFGPRRPNTEIIYRDHPDVFKSLDLEQFDQQLRELDAVLGDIESGRSRVGQFVLGTQMYDDLRKRFTQVEQDVRAAARTTDAVGQALYTDVLYRQIMAPLLGLDAALARLQSGQGDAGRLLRDAAQYQGARALIADLRQTVSAMGASPLLQSDELYDQVNRGLASAIDAVAQANRTPLLQNSLDYDNLNGWSREFAAQLRDFREHPEKYLRVKVF
jgi:phospholipid/cholesterol/gamma-HCH transport system substrate-binding protein